MYKRQSKKQDWILTEKEFDFFSKPIFYAGVGVAYTRILNNSGLNLYRNGLEKKVMQSLDLILKSEERADFIDHLCELFEIPLDYKRFFLARVFKFFYSAIYPPSGNEILSQFYSRWGSVNRKKIELIRNKLKKWRIKEKT